MYRDEYDIVTIGGGLAGSTLAAVMANHGARVLVLERETRFKDRVRGELLAPWGVEEVRLLGFREFLLEKCAYQKPTVIGMGADRDLLLTTPQAQPCFTFSHPQIEEVMLQAAEDAGAKVRRGAIVNGLGQGSETIVEFDTDSGHDKAVARLVIGADGRTSSVRKWANFKVQNDPDQQLIAEYC